MLRYIKLGNRRNKLLTATPAVCHQKLLFLAVLTATDHREHIDQYFVPTPFKINA